MARQLCWRAARWMGGVCGDPCRAVSGVCVMALASSLQKVASKIVGKFGGAVTVTVVTTGTYNTTTGVITETTTTSAIKGVLDAVNAREVNELVQSSDKKLTIAAIDLAAAPTTTDRILISGISHQIIAVNKIEQDNQAIIYTLILRA